MNPKRAIGDDSQSELTIQKLRTYPGFEDFSDEKAVEAIVAVKRLAKILFGVYKADQEAQKV
jgi:hypothetical protein